MKKDNFTKDKIEIIYSEKGEGFQELIQKAFNIHLKVDSYQINKGDKHDV